VAAVPGDVSPTPQKKSVTTVDCHLFFENWKLNISEDTTDRRILQASFCFF
jgi:hypothetical protein